MERELIMCKALATELQKGRAAERALVAHVYRMGASALSSGSKPVKYRGRLYKVSVSQIGTHQSALANV